VVDVPPGGRNDVSIVVPPPADVEVVALERSTGARA